MKRVVTFFILLSLLFISSAPIAKAEEINPSPGTYGYGSTSELSASMQLGQGTIVNGGGSAGGDLAPTGQNGSLYLILAVSLIVGSAGILIFARLKAKSSER